jgi:hypothetical protein
VPDIERDHPGRAALQEHVREASRRGADVERVVSRHVDAERVQSVRELLAPRETYGGRSSRTSSADSSTCSPAFA